MKQDGPVQIPVLQFTWYLVLSKLPFLMLREINEFEIESEKKYDIFCLFSESCASVSEH